MGVLREAAAFLENKGVENPRLNAERLMAQVLDISRMDLYLRFDQPLDMEERKAFKSLLRRRASGEPLQYIQGETEFMSLRIRVTPGVLIPRPETESLVEVVIDAFKSRNPLRVLEIGVGSGNISISLAKELEQAEITGIDVSEQAIAVARWNAEQNGVGGRIRWLRADIRCDGITDRVGKEYDGVISNPPYISQKEWPGLPDEIRLFEPKAALCDDADGYSFFKIISEKARILLRSGGWLFFEVGDGQSDKVREIMSSYGATGMAVCRDLNGIERVIQGSYGFSSVNRS